MHIPDGFLTTNIWSALWVVSIGSIGFCIKKASVLLKDKMIPLMGVMSAFIFAAQMINFPVIGGTSGHLLGGVLAATLVGPYGGAIVLAVVLVVQCFVFQDGGLTALGANIFNMSILGTVGGYLIYFGLRKIIPADRGIVVAAVVAAWLSVVITSFACALELVLSGTSPLIIVMPSMVGIHALIGIGEAVITGSVLSLLLRVRPDLIYSKEG